MLLKLFDLKRMLIIKTMLLMRLDHGMHDVYIGMV